MLQEANIETYPKLQSIMLGPLCKPSLPRSIRLLHASVQSCNLIGPPDPISHIRPIIYDDSPLPHPPTLLHHPYSLSEFLPGFPGRTATCELQWKLQRQQLDDFNHNFWIDVRFTILSSSRAKPQYQIAMYRATPASRPPRKLYSPASRAPLPSWTKKTHSQSFTSSGSCKRQVGQMNIRRNGGNAICHASCSKRGSNSTSSQLLYRTLRRSESANEKIHYT